MGTLARIVCGAVLLSCLGCAAASSTEQIDPGVRALERDLAAYQVELERLVDTGILTREDAEKFYRIASLETERRIAQLGVQPHEQMPAGGRPPAAYPPGSL